MSWFVLRYVSRTQCLASRAEYASLGQAALRRVIMSTPKALTLLKCCDMFMFMQHIVIHACKSSKRDTYVTQPT
jgi:hypothetical protein